jgi:PPM family protein phosphatase
MGIVEQTICQSDAATDVGCVRELNEDSLFCGEQFWLVADGMGGHACGEVASQMAIDDIANCYRQTGDLAQAIQVSHENIVKAGQQDQTKSGMGTTVVALSSTLQAYQVAWVGDSRAYLFDQTKQRLTQLSQDHSLIVRLIQAGLISEEDAKKHPQRHMITQCLGSVEIHELQVDTLEAQWQANQQILLCSDGLTDEVEDSRIASILAKDDSNSSKIKQLIEQAKQAGGKDNISIILVDSPIQTKEGIFNKIKLLINNIKARLINHDR